MAIEAINHAKAADVEIIVAVNKIDKPNANVEKGGELKKAKEGYAEPILSHMIDRCKESETLADAV